MKTLLAGLLLFSSSLQAQYNFESCYKLWELTAKLKNNIAPTEAEWEALHQTEGYKRKNISDERWKAFTSKIIFAFTPGNEDSLSAMSGSDLSYKYIAAFVRQEDSLKEYVKQIPLLHLIDSALLFTNKNLPSAYQNRFTPPVIYFALWDYDGSGAANQVCIDLLISYHTSKLKPGVFEAHELYHAALSNYQVKTKRFKRDPSDEHRGPFIVVNALSEEGSADLIDKEWIVFHPQSAYLQKDTFKIFSDTKAPVYISNINEALEKLSDGVLKPYTEASYWMKLIPWAAHIPGTYMSAVIKRNGLEKQVIENADNSFRFFYLYNQAAINDPGKPPVFSKKAIRFLKMLEKKYLR